MRYKPLLIILAALLLSGCNDLRRAKVSYLCKDHGGVYTIGLYDFHQSAICNTGLRIGNNEVGKLILPVEHAYKPLDN